MPKDKYLSIVVPLYNEEESVDKLIQSLLEIGKSFDFGYEIICVDDGSSDGTWPRLKALRKEIAPNLIGIKLRRNYGQTSAMVAGFDHASGDVIVTMDGDLQNDPSDIPMLLDKIREGFDIVSGWRKNRQDHFSRVLPSRVANFIISATTGVSLHDYGCSLKAYRAECIKSIKAYGEMHRFFPALASMTGARVTEMPVRHHPRRFGTSKYGFNRILKVFSDIFSMNLIIRFSSTPLKGFALSSIPFLLAALFFFVFGMTAHITGWSGDKALFFIFASVLCGMGFVHLLVMGVIGELVVGTSDLTHTRMPEITKKTIELD